MDISRFVSIRVRLCCLVALALALMSSSAAAQATNASLQGTYTFVFANQNVLEIEENMFGQEVGFCNVTGCQLPYGYSFNLTDHISQGLVTGTLIADGNGNVLSSSSFAYAPDPNSYECSSKYNATPDCPYQVPSGISWSNSTTYAVGDEVDYGGKTYQAVKSNTDVTPSGTAVCTAKSGKNPPTCTWDQLYQTGTSQGPFSGSMNGTYSVQSNGLGTMQLTLVTPSGDVPLPLTMLVPAQSAVGQEVPIYATAQLGQGGACGGGGPCGTGTAERVQ